MELWDAYNENGTLAGFDIIRGERIPENYYHLENINLFINDKKLFSQKYKEINKL